MKLAVTRTAQPRRRGQSQQCVKRPFDILRIGDFVAHTWRGDRHVSHSVREPLVSCANELTSQVEPHRRTQSRLTCSNAAPTRWPLRLPNQSACSFRESHFLNVNSVFFCTNSVRASCSPKDPKGRHHIARGVSPCPYQHLPVIKTRCAGLFPAFSRVGPGNIEPTHARRWGGRDRVSTAGASDGHLSFGCPDLGDDPNS
jgi:hypothetical protein